MHAEIGKKPSLVRFLGAAAENGHGGEGKGQEEPLGTATEVANNLRGGRTVPQKKKFNSKKLFFFSSRLFVAMFYFHVFTRPYCLIRYDSVAL